MAGKRGYSGRYKKDIEGLIGDMRLRACVLVRRYMMDEDIPLADRVSKAAVLIVAKMIPQKAEIAVNHSLSLPPELAAKLISIAERNLAIQNELRAIESEIPTTYSVLSNDAQNRDSGVGGQHEG